MSRTSPITSYCCIDTEAVFKDMSLELVLVWRASVILL